MSHARLFRYFKTSPEVIRLAVMMYVRYTLSLRNVEDLLHERGIDTARETVRFWWNRFGVISPQPRPGNACVSAPPSAPRRGVREDQRREALPLARGRSRRRGTRELRHPVARQGGGAEIPAQALKRHGPVDVIVTDRLASYGAALKAIRAHDKRQVGRGMNNRVENSHLPFRRRERAMLRFRRMRSLQKFAALHGSVHNHFNQDRHLSSRENFKDRRAAALAEWRQLCAA